MASKSTTLTATFELIDEMSDKLASIAENGTSAANSFDEISNAASSAESAATGSAKTTAQSVDDMGDSFEKSGNKAESSGQKMSTAITTVAQALSAAGVVKLVKEFADTMMECSDVAAEFETAMLKVSTVADTAEVPLGDLTAGVKQLSMETGRSTTELSEAMYQALSASVDTADAVEFTSTAVKLAAGGFTSTTTAVDVLTTALNAYGLEASEADRISDMLITTQNLGKTTVDDLAKSMGRVIPTASAYGVEMDNVSAAYAELTRNGLNTRISTTYLNSMLQELGDSGSNVASILREQTGMSLSELMDSGYSLGDVLEVLGNTVNGDSAAFNELWSSSTAGMAALTLFNSGADSFNETLAAMGDSAGATTSAFETMTDSTQHAKEELSNAATNLQESIGSAINPAIEKMYEAGTKVLNFFTNFADAHPIVVKAAAAIAVGIAAVTVAITAVSVVIPLVTKAVIALGTAFNSALGPIGWVAMGIGAVAAAATAFVAMLNEDNAEYNTWTASTKNQYDALQDLTRQYDELSASGTASQEELDRLRYQIDDATEAFEKGKQTIEQYTAEVDALCESVDSLYNEYHSAIDSIDDNQKGTDALIQKYADLASQADLTAAEQLQLDAVTKSLSNSYPDLVSNLSDAGASTEDFVASLRKAAQQEAEEAKFAQSQQTYVDALQKRSELEEEIAKTEEMLADEQARMDNMSGWEHLWTTNEWDGVNAYTEALDELNAAMAENDALINGIESDWADIAEAQTNAAEGVSTYEEAVSYAYESVREEVEALCQSYDDAYQAALESFEGQFGLFDEAQADMSATVDAAQAALDSQLEYWTAYGDNVEKLKSISAEDLGITQESYENLMSYVQDGSEEAAGLAASMVEAIEEGNTEAVTTLANTMEEVSAKQEEVAASTADWQTNFTEQMNQYAQEMNSIVTNDLELSAEAAQSATETINAYADSILAGKGAAVAAAQEVASAVTSALSSANAKINVSVSSSGSAAAKANGTTNAPDVFIAGEKGPELIVPAHAAGTTEGEPYYLAGEHGPELIIGQQGSEVFPASETDRIIRSLNERDNTATAIPYQISRMIESLGEQIAEAASPTGKIEKLIDSINAQPENMNPQVIDHEPQIITERQSGDLLPASEANRLIQSLNYGEKVRSGNETLKHIVLEIAGSGSIEVSSGADLNSILAILQDNLKPVLMNILQQEVLEEGDLSYEY